MSHADYASEKAKLEQTFQEQVLALRSAAQLEAARLYGLDSQQYKDATAAKIDAEQALQKATQGVTAALDAARDWAGHAGRRLRALGEDGEEGGSRAAAGLRQISAEADLAAGKTRDLGAGLKGFASGFYGQWDQITNFFNGKSLQEVQDWTNKNQNALYGATKSSFETALQQQLRDVARNKLNDLTNQVTAATPATPAAPRAAASSKTVTVQFRDASGKQLAGAFDESSASAMIEMLRRSGMVSA
jgi:hypothetical protein